MKIEIIAIRFIDEGNYGKDIETINHYIYSSNVPFDFDKFYTELENLHDSNNGSIGFGSEVDEMAKKFGLNRTECKVYDYRY